MICFSGKEVCAVYLGNMPVTAMYIGNSLVWQDCRYFETETTATLALSSECGPLGVAGFTYSAEAPLSLPAAVARPYMRHIAPMLVKNPLSAIGWVSPEIDLTSISEATENGLATIISKPISAQGALGESVPNTFPLSPLNIVPGNGAVSGLAHVPDMIHQTPLTVSTGAISALRHGLYVIYNIPITDADAEKRSAEPSKWATLSKVKTLKSLSDSFKCISPFPMTAAAEVKSNNADIKTCGTNAKLSPECCAVSEVGGAGESKTQSFISGTCSVSMKTEPYQPVNADFDTTPIADMDAESIANIDIMTIKI
ncbi:MAG: hypothetical protein IJX30_03175 [Clostridia bacterium]|nr:hypothetical protein [Clostridia bacterium]